MSELVKELSNERCPFCKSRAVRHSVQGVLYRCGTLGPDDKGKYSTGHYVTALEAEIDQRASQMISDLAEIKRLTSEVERLTTALVNIQQAADAGISAVMPSGVLWDISRLACDSLKQAEESSDE